MNWVLIYAYQVTTYGHAAKNIIDLFICHLFNNYLDIPWGNLFCFHGVILQFFYAFLSFNDNLQKCNSYLLSY